MKNADLSKDELILKLEKLEQSELTFKSAISSMTDAVVIAKDITEKKSAEAELKNLEWLLLPGKERFALSTPEYGDLSELNQDRTILDAVGKEVLSDIVGDYLALLDTSAAVYEKSGDYAFGTFSSDWCRFLDYSSRKLCNCDNNRTALKSGKWLCHESCWEDASLQSIRTNQPVDIECSGGLHIYAIPIKADNQVVGSINFGYGNPPADDDKLKEIAARYEVSFDKLKELANKYEARPAFIIDIAKQKLETSARLIGEIVERKLAEKALQKSAEKFHSLFENINVGVALNEIVIDEEGKPVDFVFLDVNPLYEEITNLKRENIVGKRGLEIIPHLKQKWIDIYGEVALSGKPVSLVDHSSHLDKYLEVKVYSPGKGQFALAIADITDKIKSEQEIIDSKETAELYLEMAGSIILSLDVNGKVLLINKKGLEILEYDNKKDLIGRNWFDTCILPEKIDNTKRIFSKVIKGDMKVIEHVDNEVVTRTGDRKVISWYNSCIEDKAGRIKYMLSSGNDVTERKLAEKQLEISLEEKEILLRELYHRTKNNMQLISSMLGLRAMSVNNQEFLNIFKDIENKILSMALVHKKLYESGDLSHINLKEYLEDLVKQINQSFANPSQHLEIKIRSIDLHVILDIAIPLGIVINEVLTNAIKHAFPDNRNGRIDIDLDQNIEQQIILQISDNGIGLQEGFDIKNDSGFGMQTSVKLVETQLGGKMTFESRNGLTCRIILKKELYEPRV